MKKLCTHAGILICMLLCGNILSAQNPFDFTPTNSSGLLFGKVILNDGQPSANDWIAAIDSDGNVAGAVQLIEFNGEFFINLPIYGDDVTTPSVDEGINGNEKFSLQLYIAALDAYAFYRLADTVVAFNEWTNTNGTPIPAYSNSNVIYPFWKASFDPNALMPVCENAEPYLLSGGSPNGGIYGGSGVINDDSFSASVTGAGSFDLLYVFTSPDGTQDTATAEQFVNELPDVQMPLLDPICVDGGSISLNGGTPIGGSYSGPGVADNAFNPLTAGVGTHEIVYTYTDENMCTGQASNNILVGEEPEAAFSFTQDGLSISLTSEAAGASSISWDFGDGNMSTETNPEHTFASSGVYMVKLKALNFCGADSSIQEVSVIATSLPSTLPKPDIAVYPNPNAGSFQLLLSSTVALQADLRVTNLVGKTIWSHQHMLQAGQDRLVVSLGNIPSGIYILSVKNGSFTQVRKFTVLK